MATVQHPGKVLDHWMKSKNLNCSSLGLKLQVPSNRLGQIVNGTRRITPETALRLGKCFGTSPVYWIQLQSEYDLDVAKQKLGSKLLSIVPYSSV
jgi:antitoxin HigA-1